MATFNVLEAAVRWGAPRFVNLSSETVPGFFFAERPFLPDYVPVDEEHPVRPQDPYATAKHFGEQLMDAATRRSDITGGIDPAVVGAVGGQHREQPRRRGCASRRPSEGFWAYIDVYDLADAIRLAAEAATPGHEVVYIASPDIASHETLEVARPPLPRRRRRRRSARRTRRARTGSRSPRRGRCSATTRSARGATTSTTRAGCAPPPASGSSGARPASSAGAGCSRRLEARRGGA